jgi:hypothetical protein
MSGTKPLVLKAASNCYSDVTKALDPECVFQARARELAAASKPGIERFAYNLFGPNFLGSLAFAIDPLRQFRVDTAAIVPANRTRTMTTVFPQTRKTARFSKSKSCSGQIGGPVCVGLANYPNECTTSTAMSGPWTLSSQPGYSGFARDTTVRTRPMGAKFGEFEMFKLGLTSHSPTESTSWVQNTDLCLPCASPFQWLHNHYDNWSVWYGPHAYMSVPTMDAVKTAEIANATAYISKYMLGMLDTVQPTRRSYSAIYNVLELKDLPMMLRSTVQLARDGYLRTIRSSKKISNQYLNEKFGWESTLSAVKDMLILPSKIAKRLNFLMLRNGKDTSFHALRKFTEPVSSPPAFVDDWGSWYGGTTSSTSARRDIELRLMINVGLRMPDISVPSVREDLISRFSGWRLSPSDVYNLVPWTWLVDWFSGLGDYISILDTVHQDPSLINYGFITYLSKGESTTTFVTKGSVTDSYSYCGTSKSDTRNLVFTHPSRANWTYQIRKDISHYVGVKSLTNFGSLSVAQQAIIGALLFGKVL